MYIYKCQYPIILNIKLHKLGKFNPSNRISIILMTCPIFIWQGRKYISKKEKVTRLLNKIVTFLLRIFLQSILKQRREIHIS